MTRILLVDDHAVLREGLKEVLAKAFSKPRFGNAENGEEALALVRQGGWDLVVLDLSLPGKSGLMVLKEIKEAAPALPVVILSMQSEREYAIRALRAGAAAYVPKRLASQELVVAIQKALAGGKYVPGSTAESLAFALERKVPEKPHEALSDREYEVFHLLALNESVSEIAEKLGLSIHTVSTYRTRILAKLGATTDAHLTHYALENELIP